MLCLMIVFNVEEIPHFSNISYCKRENCIIRTYVLIVRHLRRLRTYVSLYKIDKFVLNWKNVRNIILSTAKRSFTFVVKAKDTNK